ncbi:FAD-dependent oxidoreductase [Bacteroides gallinaceum]|uniref:FAD-dependent oxidoreductase n=1 Tax=Bacteroides gallinaceum TaxID=1462571 RepID=UPI0025A420C5|nr:FAD-dependent oxidoreductase [Bacteroides gallinaceum]MDM8154767.1 FAD-dependent oxidoreductase [Bacteroides gallinaceum]
MKALLPWMEVDAVDVALYMPTDAFIDSALLCSSYAKAAARLGVTLRPNCKVKEIMVEGEHIDVSCFVA